MKRLNWVTRSSCALTDLRLVRQAIPPPDCKGWLARLFWQQVPAHSAAALLCDSGGGRSGGWLGHAAEHKTLPCFYLVC